MLNEINARLNKIWNLGGTYVTKKFCKEFGQKILQQVMIRIYSRGCKTSCLLNQILGTNHVIVRCQTSSMTKCGRYATLFPNAACPPTTGYLNSQPLEARFKTKRVCDEILLMKRVCVTALLQLQNISLV